MHYPSPEFHNSPLGAVIKAALIILVGEFLIMVAIEGIFSPLFSGEVSPVFWEFLDTVLLAFIATPAFYVFVLRPMQAQQLGLEQQQLHMDSIFEGALDAIVLMDQKGVITGWSGQADRIFGWSRAEAIGKPLHEMIIPARYRERHVSGLKHFLSTGHGPVIDTRMEVTALHRDGHEFPIELAISLLKSAEVAEFSSFIRDISVRKRIEKSLRDSEEHLKTIFETLSEGVALNEMIFNSDGEMVDYKILEVNGAFYKTADFIKNGPAIGQTATQLYGISSEMIIAFWSAHKNTTLAVDSEMLSPLSQRWFSITTSPFMHGRFVTTFRDITERKRSEYALRAGEEKLRGLYELSPLGIALTDMQGRYVEFNQAFEHICGYSEDELKQLDYWVLTPKKYEADEARQLESLAQTGRYGPYEKEYRRKDGSLIPLRLNGVLMTDRNGTQSIWSIVEDISEEKRNKEHIEKLAHFDQLTGLPNRSLLSDHFKYALSLAQRSGEQLAVIFLDLDHFKNINDTLGHSIGDQLLVEIAKRLKASLRAEDTLSRQGGDEFIMILPGTNADGAAHVAEKLLAAVAQPCFIQQYELTATPSVGIAIYPHDGENMEALSRSADTAMYRAKQNGRNNFSFFTPEMQAQSARNLRLANALRHALTRNELQLYYQPQLSIQDGHIVGAEALLRWQHPELGMISPAEFIPIAEDSGQIIQIGEWVLRTAVNQMKKWIDGGLPKIVVAVNLSAVQFRQPGLTGLVTTILAEAQLHHEHLELELTEAAMMDDPQSAIAVMNHLHDQGIRMSIDDFGTGYSSLSYLKQFKVYKLKIDQSFVRDISDDPEDKAIVTAIINMAASLGMQTIAEGVETASQLAFLRLQGCNEVQGYYFSKPLRVEQFEEFAKKF